jgi:hypothetical protein
MTAWYVVVVVIDNDMLCCGVSAAAWHAGRQVHLLLVDSYLIRPWKTLGQVRADCCGCNQPQRVWSPVLWKPAVVQSA